MTVIRWIKRFWNRLRGRNTNRLFKDLQDYAPTFEKNMKDKYGEYMGWNTHPTFPCPRHPELTQWPCPKCWVNRSQNIDNQ